jgi:hypothetical protein
MGNGIMAETSTKQVIASRRPFSIKRRRLLLLSFVLFVTGCMLSLFLCSAFVDLFGESFQVPGYMPGGGAPISLKQMDCPVFLSKQEPGIFSAVVSNPTNSEHRASVTFLTREAIQSLSPSDQVVLLPPNATRQVTWLVSFDEPGSHFVQVKLTNDDPAPQAYDKEGFSHCGVAILNVLRLPAGIVIFLDVGVLVLAIVIAIYALRRL